jgi:uncharacterized Zn finger protein
MNLDDFEWFLDKKILKRGRSYYEEGRIVSLEQIGDVWKAAVQGGKLYSGKVGVSEDGVRWRSECDCPYGKEIDDPPWINSDRDIPESRYCKHQAAVLYALRDKYEAGEFRKEAIDKEELRKFLEKLDKETLIAIIIDLAGRDAEGDSKLIGVTFDEKMHAEVDCDTEDKGPEK